MTAARRLNDHYGAAPETWATRELLRRLGPRVQYATVLEPCSGRGNIAAAIRDWTRDQESSPALATNDIDPAMEANTHRDAFNADLYDPAPDWIITNPPFNLAPLLVPIWVQAARRGVACLLRLTFLEPVGNRWIFLDEHPPDRLLVLPRMSFTGDGKTDSVTCAWMIWERDPVLDIQPPAIEILTPKQDNGRLAI